MPCSDFCVNTCGPALVSVCVASKCEGLNGPCVETQPSPSDWHYAQETNPTMIKKPSDNTQQEEHGLQQHKAT